MSFDPPSASPNIGPRGAAGPKSQIFNFFKNSRVIPHLKRNFMLNNINKGTYCSKCTEKKLFIIILVIQNFSAVKI